MQVSRRLSLMLDCGVFIETNKESILNGSLNVPLYQSDDNSQSVLKPPSSTHTHESMNQLGPTLRPNA